MYRVIASCIAVALMANAVQGATLLNSSQTTPYTVSATDLLQTNLASTASTGSFTNFGAAGLPALVNGTGGTAPANTLGVSAIPSDGSTVTYSLNIAQFPQGYQVNSIDTYGAWDDGRDRQDVAISYSTVAAPALFFPLTSYQFEPPNLFSRVNVTPDIPQPFLATGVAAVRFSFAGQENGGAGFREFDVFGAGVGSPAFIPIPVPLQNATAIASQASFPVSNLLDNNAGTGWADDLGSKQVPAQTNFTPANAAVFETVSDVTGAGELVFTFTSGGNFLGNHTVGRFRLSATTDNRFFFADGLGDGGDVTANWIVLDPLTASSTNASSVMTELGDNSILVSGTPITTNETYTIKTNKIAGNITGFRIEMLEDPSLPTLNGIGGPGRAANGNYVMYDFNVVFNAAPPVPEPATALLGILGAAGLLLRRRRIA